MSTSIGISKHTGNLDFIFLLFTRMDFVLAQEIWLFRPGG